MTQCEKILRHMREVGPITQAEAISYYGCYRLGARIVDLKKQGHKIRYDEPVRFAQYSLEEGGLCETR